jgi:Zn-dependent peptidase ImmA (M78 family)/DNA-binding XRE family transcriptional regulator
MVEALITPKIVSWARNRAQLTKEELAKKMSVSVDKITAWENEDKRVYPSFNQAMNLSRKLYIPLGYLYLAEPPKEDIPLPDLRTINNQFIERPSANFIDVLYDAYRKQDWFRDYLIKEEAPMLEFAGKYSVNTDVKLIASDIRDTLKINEGTRKQSSSWGQYFTELVRRVEDARILVLRSSIVFNNTHRKLDVDEFRGFAIFDNIAPLVFINTGDYKAAQIFTLIHEIAHIWLGESGISNLDFKLKDVEQSYLVERVCDSIAGEVLVPEDELTALWNGSYGIGSNISKLSSDFKVSSFVILRRVYNLDVISEDDYINNYRKLIEKIRPKSKESGGDFYNSLKARNSPTFTAAVVAGLSSGSVTPSEATSLLNVHYSSLKKLEGSFG